MQMTSANKPLSDDSIDSFLKAHLPEKSPWTNRRHLLDTRELKSDEVSAVMQLAKACKQVAASGTKPATVLANRVISTVFYENSTRTRSSFELAAKKLGATVLNLDIGSSSVAKGETILDTAQTLAAMGTHLIVQRHSSSGSAHQIAAALDKQLHVVNAGDGWNGHPTQGLLDFFTMQEVRASLKGAKIAIVGDITHSRVARSILWLLKMAGADVHMAGPPTLIPAEMSSLGVTVHNRLEPAIEGCDFVMALRLQLERQTSGLIPSTSEYKKLYRLDHHRLRLCNPQVRIMHPGPVNRGIEITDELAGDPDISLINTQVQNGVAVRMAVLYLLLGTKEAGK